MTNVSAPVPLRERNRIAARDAVLDAAERLLGRGDAVDFSMRALAAEAGVGFATPFNHFGSKLAIMQALSSRLIDRMAARFEETAAGARTGPSSRSAADGVFAVGRIAVELLLERPEVYKTVVGSLGTAGTVPAAVRPQSTALWALALGDFSGIAKPLRPLARDVLAEQLAFVFRGCVSFWIAGETSDAELARTFECGASLALLGFADTRVRPRLLARLRAGGTAASR